MMVKSVHILCFVDATMAVTTAAHFLHTTSLSSHSQNKHIRAHAHLCGTPTDFTPAGCKEIKEVGERVDAPSGVRYSQVSCFSFCKRQGVGGSAYFGLEKGGRVCWCGSFYHASDVDGQRCSVKCDGSDQPCGGEDANVASVFVAFDCTPATEEEIVKKREEERERVESMFVRSNNVNCITDDNRIRMNGEVALVGSEYDCKLACNSKMTCHGFTYEKGPERCIFHDDAMSGPVADTDRVCFWRKIDGVSENMIIAPSEDAIDTDASENVIDTDASEDVIDNDASEDVIDTDASEDVIDADVSENVIDTDVSENVIDTDASENVIDADASENVGARRRRRRPRRRLTRRLRRAARRSSRRARRAGRRRKRE